MDGGGYDHRSDTDSLTLRRRRHHSPLSLPACFRPSDAADPDSPTGGGAPAPSPSTWSQLPSPSAWFRSKAHDLPQKYRNLVSRGSSGARHHRRHHSADFRYDPLSYALNFDEGASDAGGGGGGVEVIAPDELRYRTFSARLPATPPRPARLQTVVSGRESPL